MPQVPLHSIVYASVAFRSFSEEELAALLAHSRKRNRQIGVTGMLLYKSGCFLQAIEGEEKEVHRLYRSIENDPRHHHIVTLRDESIEERDFSDWTMGFKHPSDEDMLHQPGFSEMVKMMIHHGRCSMEKSLAIKLLRSFTGQQVESDKVGSILDS